MASNADARQSARLAELARIEEDALYSAKGHFEASADAHRLYVCLGLPVALIGGVAGVSAFSTFAKHNVVAGVLALVAAGLGAVNTFLNPADKAAVHTGLGNDYNSLRNRARLCREMEAPDLSQAQLAKRIVSLSNERDELNKKSTQVPRRAFERARQGIEEGEARYAGDESAEQIRRGSDDATD